MRLSRPALPFGESPPCISTTLSVPLVNGCRVGPGIRHRDQQSHSVGAQSGGLSVYSRGTTEADRAAIEEILHGRIVSLQKAGKIAAEILYLNVGELPEVDRQFLVERQLISREHADSEGRGPW